MRKKKEQKRRKHGANRSQAKAKSNTKKAALKRRTARKSAKRRSRPVPQTQAIAVGQSVGTPRSRRLTRAAAGGAGGGDFGGASLIPSADSESVDRLLEEGQTFEAGIVSGVENAREPDRGEVRTREVPEDDVPEEYDNQDRP